MAKMKLIVTTLLMAVLALSTPLTASAGHSGPEVAREDGTAMQETITNQDNPLANHLIWEWIAFGILFVVLAKIGFPWMFKQMDARQTRIREALEKADKVRSEAERLLAKHETMMAESHAEAKRITDEAIRAAEKVKADITNSAQEEANAIVDRAKKEIGMAQTKAMDELRTHAVDLSLQASSAVLGRALTGDDQRRLASEAITAAEKAMSN